MARLFYLQYKHVEEMFPDRMTLQSIQMREGEGFREHTHRWRDIASQIQPPIPEKELNKIFLQSLPDEYYDKMVG